MVRRINTSLTAGQGLIQARLTPGGGADTAFLTRRSQPRSTSRREI